MLDLELTLDLQRLYYPKINIAANSGHDPDETISSVSFDTGCAFRQIISEKRLHINYFFKTEEPNDLNLPYSLDIHLYAVFNFEPELSKIIEEDRDELLLDIANLMVGSLRELIASTTSRGPWGAYFIPITDVKTVAEGFLKSYKKEESRKRKRPMKSPTAKKIKSDI